MNSGFGEVASYSPLQEAVDEQRKPPPTLLKLTLLALIVAGLPPLTETEALLALYSQVVPPQVNFPPALVTLIVPLPPLPVTSADHGVNRDDAVQAPSPEVQFFQVTEVISPVTATPEPPPALVVLPLIEDDVHSIVTNPEAIFETVPATSEALIEVPLP